MAIKPITDRQLVDKTTINREFQTNQKRWWKNRTKTKESSKQH